MKITASILFILSLAIVAAAQRKPVKIGVTPDILKEDYAPVYDIRKFVKYCIQADSTTPRRSKRKIVEILSVEPTIKYLDDCSSAEFTIVYLERSTGTQMRVFYIRDKMMWTVWGEDRNAKKAEKELAAEFLKVLKRNKNLDKKIIPGETEN